MKWTNENGFDWCEVVDIDTFVSEISDFYVFEDYIFPPSLECSENHRRIENPDTKAVGIRGGGKGHRAGNVA